MKGQLTKNFIPISLPFSFQNFIYLRRVTPRIYLHTSQSRVSHSLRELYRSFSLLRKLSGLRKTTTTIMFFVSFSIEVGLILFVVASFPKILISKKKKKKRATNKDKFKLSGKSSTLTKNNNNTFLFNKKKTLSL